MQGAILFGYGGDDVIGCALARGDIGDQRGGGTDLLDDWRHGDHGGAVGQDNRAQNETQHPHTLTPFNKVFGLAAQNRLLPDKLQTETQATKPGRQRNGFPPKPS